jgi:hypothetical protein
MILEKHTESLQKKLFDAGNKNDLSVFKSFMETGKWMSKGCPFILEWPYLTVPDMIKDKITRHILKVSDN